MTVLRTDPIFCKGCNVTRSASGTVSIKGLTLVASVSKACCGEYSHTVIFTGKLEKIVKRKKK